MIQLINQLIWSIQAAFSRTTRCVFVGTNVGSCQDKLRIAEEQQQQED